jgi:hypothetical protein
MNLNNQKAGTGRICLKAEHISSRFPIMSRNLIQKNIVIGTMKNKWYSNGLRFECVDF